MIFDNVTTREKAEAYKATNDILLASLSEIRQLSKKKPDAMLTTTKVTIVNRVLFDLLAFLQQEPEGKYLKLLDEVALPQVSDALLQMVQFEVALSGFRKRYTVFNDFDEECWVTPEFVAEREADDDDDDDDDDDTGSDDANDDDPDDGDDDDDDDESWNDDDSDWGDDDGDSGDDGGAKMVEVRNLPNGG